MILRCGYNYTCKCKLFNATGKIFISTNALISSALYVTWRKFVLSQLRELLILFARLLAAAVFLAANCREAFAKHTHNAALRHKRIRVDFVDDFKDSIRLKFTGYAHHHFAAFVSV